MAWALGLFFTDGHLRPRVGYTAPRICFTQKTPELLYKLRALLRSDTTIHYRPRQQYNRKTAGAVFQFAIANARLGARLMELGITPRKSLTIGFPEIPADFTRHLIRGCWDGDGSVLLHANGRDLTAKFGCGSLRFVEGCCTPSAGMDSQSVGSIGSGPAAERSSTTTSSIRNDLISNLCSTICTTTWPSICTWRESTTRL